MYFITILFKNLKEVEIDLSKDDIFLDKLICPLDTHFDTLLVTCIDKILKRNTIDLSLINKVNIEGYLEENSVALNIAKSVAEAIKTR
jgi:hypothetical protein